MVEIIDLPAGACVEGPGLYRTPLSHYHTQDICPGPSVSSSGLRRIALSSAHHFWKTTNINPNRYPEKPPNSSLILGRAAHCLILGDEVFDEHFIYVPEDAPRRPTATQVKAFERDGVWSAKALDGAAYWSKFDEKAGSRDLLTHEQITTIGYMSENLAANPEANAVLTSENYEISIIWQDELTGIWVKARPDSLPINHYGFGDLKTFAPKSSDLLFAAHASTRDYGYAMQMSLCIEGFNRVIGPTNENCALIFVQTSEPYEVIPYEVESADIELGHALNRVALDRLAHGLKTNEWPGVITGFYKPAEPSLLRAYNRLEVTGELPTM